MSGESFKEEGNAKYKAKDFQGAVASYSAAITADPSNAVYYSNRAAAYQEAGNFSAALADAKKSTELLPGVAKAHNRVGAALWSLGRLPEALQAYEKALSLAPGDDMISRNIEKIKSLLARPSPQQHQQQQQAPPRAQAGAVPPALGGNRVDAMLDVAIAASAALQFVLSLLSPANGQLLWLLVLALMAGRCGLILSRQGQLRPTRDAFNFLIHNFGGQYLLLCVALLVLRAPAIPVLCAAIGIYAVVDAASAQRGAVDVLVPALTARFGAQLDRVRANNDALLINAAMCEIMAVLFALFSGSMITVVATYQFVRFRYRSDQYVRMNFQQIGQAVEQASYHRYCPPAVGNILRKVKGFFGRMAV